jgi:tetraprenyl-beta-curcumene synthase
MHANRAHAVIRRSCDWVEPTAALLAAQTRYWSTVAPAVRAQLERWHGHAETIADPILRAHAAAKLCEERDNTSAIATLCTLAPRRYRSVVVDAAVALQVMYDYLDAVTEEPVPDALASGRQLFRTFAVALTPGEAPLDYYRYHPCGDDSGYLDALVASVQNSISELPSSPTVLPVARRAAARFSEAQVRSHAVATAGVAQLRDWARRNSGGTGLLWWEWAGGAAASVLVVHALISAAADARTTSSQAIRLGEVYLLYSAFTTMLDSVVDNATDSATGAHRYSAYYRTTHEAGHRVAHLACRALNAGGTLPRSSHHRMTVAGVAAFYLSEAQPGSVPGAVSGKLIPELRPLIKPLVLAFRMWRWIRHCSARIADRPACARTHACRRQR